MWGFFEMAKTLYATWDLNMGDILHKLSGLTVANFLFKVNL